MRDRGRNFGWIARMALVLLVAGSAMACIDSSQAAIDAHGNERIDAAHAQADGTPAVDAAPSDASPIDATAKTDASTIDAPTKIDAPTIDAPPKIDAPPTIDGPTVDAPTAIDAPTVIDAPTTVDGPTIDAPTAFRHTITIDGTNDFVTASERFATTTGGFFAFVTWDQANLYVAYDATDVAAGDPNKWVQIYLDVDPTTSNGSATGETYNTETPAFPTGFRADFALRWKTDDSFIDLRQFGAGGWTTSAATGIQHARTGTFVEFAIPLAALGSPSQIGVASLMLNETAFAEAAFAGLYAGSFTDGYHTPTIDLAHFLLASFADSAAPNAAAHEKP